MAAIDEADLAELPDLGDTLNHETLWRFQLATLTADGWDLSAEDLVAEEATHGGGDA